MSFAHHYVLFLFTFHRQEASLQPETGVQLITNQLLASLPHKREFVVHARWVSLTSVSALHSFCIPESTLSFTLRPSVSHECLMVLPAALWMWRQHRRSSNCCPELGRKKKSSNVCFPDNKLATCPTPQGKKKGILLWSDNMSHPMSGLHTEPVFSALIQHLT